MIRISLLLFMKLVVVDPEYIERGDSSNNGYIEPRMGANIYFVIMYKS